MSIDPDHVQDNRHSIYCNNCGWILYTNPASLRAFDILDCHNPRCALSVNFLVDLTPWGFPASPK
jgi:hypothetical protein